MRSKKLKLRDIGVKGDKTSKIAAYVYLQDRILREKPTLYINDKRAGFSVVSDIDLISWRAKDVYFFANKGSKVACIDVYHATIHYLLAHKFGAQLKGRPNFLLLCESIASLSDYYFDLEILRLYGANPKEEAKAMARIRTALDLWGEKGAHKRVYSLMESESEKQSFDKFRDAAMGMFEYYKHLLAQDNDRSGESKLDISEIYRGLRKNKNIPLFHQYRLGNNIMYAKYHGGLTTSEDQYTVEACTNLLNSVDSFINFLRELDTPAEQNLRSAA